MLREDALAVIRTQAAHQGVISWAQVEELAWSGSTPPPITARMALVRIIRTTGTDLVLCASMDPGAPAVSFCNAACQAGCGCQLPLVSGTAGICAAARDPVPARRQL